MEMLYGDVGKHSNFKAKKYKFSLPNESFKLKTSFLKIEGKSVVSLLTIRPP